MPGYLIFNVFFIIFYVPKNILQKKVCKRFCVELIQIRIMAISGQMYVLFDVHFSDFPEMCIPGDLHILAQNRAFRPGYRTVKFFK